MDLDELLKLEPDTWHEVRSHGPTECRTYTFVSGGHFGVVRSESAVTEGRCRYEWQVRPLEKVEKGPPPLMPSGWNHKLEEAKRAVAMRLATIRPDVTITVFKVNAASEEDAVERVDDWMLDLAESPCWESYWINGQSEAVKTKADFQRLRAKEIEEAGSRLRRAIAEPDVEIKGRHLRRAADLFISSEELSPHRLVCDLTEGEEPEDDEQVYYIEAARR